MLLYLATNIKNKKQYIGATTRSLEERKAEHLKTAFGKSPKCYFHRALKKYGIDSFTWEVICKCDTEEQLSNKETEYIEKLGTFVDGTPGGYNLTTGGQSSFKMSEETRAKQSAAKKGELNPMYGRTGKLHPMYGRTGELCPNYGRTDKIEPMYGKTEEGGPNYSKRHHVENSEKQK